jgi:hypothetical protein
MQFKLSAIDALTLSTVAKRDKAHLDAVVAGMKNAKRVDGDRYGYNEKLKTHVNPDYPMVKLKDDSDLLESDIRSIKSVIVEHNARTKVSFHDATLGETVSVSIFDAFNTLKDMESDLTRKHSELVSGVSVTALVDTPADEVEFDVSFSEVEDGQQQDGLGRSR